MTQVSRMTTVLRDRSNGNDRRAGPCQARFPQHPPVLMPGEGCSTGTTPSHEHIHPTHNPSSFTVTDPVVDAIQRP